MNRAYADVVFERVAREMSAAPAPRVKLIYDERGVFTSAKLQEQAKYFLARAAKPAAAPMTPERTP